MTKWGLRTLPEEPAPAFPALQGSVPGRLRSAVWSVPVTLPCPAGRDVPHDRLPLGHPLLVRGSLTVAKRAHVSILYHTAYSADRIAGN